MKSVRACIYSYELDLSTLAEGFLGLKHHPHGHWVRQESFNVRECLLVAAANIAPSHKFLSLKGKADTRLAAVQKLRNAR